MNNLVEKGKIMPSLEMKGPYVYSSAKIDEVVTQTSAGNYALGYSKEGKFRVQYVGRSDNNVNEELKVKLNGKYDKFKFSYASSPKEAFEKECRNYHDFGAKEKLANENHPDRPNDADWKCPVCNIFS